MEIQHLYDICAYISCKDVEFYYSSHIDLSDDYSYPSLFFNFSIKNIHKAMSDNVYINEEDMNDSWITHKGNPGLELDKYKYKNLAVSVKEVLKLQYL